MPRAGLTSASVTEAGADLVDEMGFDQLSMGLLADRLGVRTPSLYKHVANQAELAHSIAVLAMTELADAIGDAIQGRAGKDALVAGATAMRTFAREHPGRYAAGNAAQLNGPDDPLLAASRRVMGSWGAMLHGYHLEPSQEIHALRMLRSMLHGFLTLESGGRLPGRCLGRGQLPVDRRLRRPGPAGPSAPGPGGNAMSVDLTSTITIDASPAEVWAVLTDFASYGEWSNFSSIRGTAVEGTKIAIRMPGMSFSPTLTIVRPNAELQWASTLLSERLFRGQHSFRLSTNPDGTTLLTNNETFFGIAVAPFKRLLESRKDTGYDGFNRALKARVENATTPPPA